MSTYSPQLKHRIAALAVILCIPLTGSAQVLLSNTEFAILGGTAVSVGGPGPNPIVNGHVGLSPGATSNITGFPPAVVSGITAGGSPATIISTGGQTAQARADLITAKNALYAMPIVPANLLSNLDLGTLAPLKAGVYTFGGAATQTGTVVLDANFQNGVAWVFNIATSLTTSVNSAVTFINLGTNGGSDLGLFWNAGTAINIGDNNTIIGNYLAGTSISFTGITSTLGGGGTRALALAGVSFAGPGSLNPLGGPGGGDYDGGLKYDPNGNLVPSSSGSGPIIIPPGVVDGGTGTFGGDVENSGTLSPGLAIPGAAPDTLATAGNFTQTATGNLVIKLASATSFDQLVVQGTATLDGNVQLDTVGGFDPLGQSFTFLTATDGVTGAFATVSGTAVNTNRAAIAALLSYNANSVSVAFSQLPFAGFAATPNQASVAAAAQVTPAQTAALNTLPLASQFPAALNAISPQPYQVWSNFAFASATALADRVGRAGRLVTAQDDYYVEGGQSRGRARGDLDVGSTSYTTSTGMVGGNRPFSESGTVGAFYSHGKTISGLGSERGKTVAKDHTLGLRAGWTSGPLFAETLFAYGFNRYESTRAIDFPGTTALATSSTKGRQWTTGFTVGRHFTSGILSVSPFGGLHLTRWSARSFEETGAGDFNVTVAKQSAKSLRSRVGVEARATLGMFQPHVRASWLHEFSDDSRAINASVGTVPYAVATRRGQRDIGIYSAGLDVVLGPRALVYTDVSAQSGDHTKVLTEWRVGLSVRY